MSIQTFPNYPLSKGSNLTRSVRVLEKSLGDGYTQTAMDGINHIALSFKAVFENRLTSEINVIAQFLRDHGGYTAFEFTLPYETMPRRWRCKKWDGPNWVSASYRSLTATLEEDFGL